MKFYLKNQVVVYFLKILFIFFLLYDISLTFISYLTSARLAMLGLVIVFLSTKKIKIDKNWFLFVLMLFSLLLLSIFQFLSSNDLTQTLRIAYFLVYCMFGSYLFKYFIKDIKELYWLFIIAVFFQAVILISSFLIPQFKDILAHYVLYGGNFTVEEIYRAFGLSSTTGAALSIIQSIGVVTGCFLFYKHSSLKVRIIIFIIILTCLISTAITGRTGLLMSLLSILGLIFVLLKHKKRYFINFIILIFVFFIGINKVIDDIFSDLEGFNVEYFTEWVLEVSEIKDSKTIEAVNEMPIPTLSIETILGTGKIVAIDGTNASKHDSGYIQTYYSLGLPLSLLFYISFLLFLISKLDFRGKQKWTIFLIFIMFLVETKEPFIFKYSFPFFVIVTLFVAKHEVDIKMVESKYSNL